MKRTLIILLALCLALGLLPACGSDPAAECDGLKVVAVSFPGYDLARSVMAGRGELTMLLKPGAESHSYDPTPQDMIKIQDCDLFICTGGESEAWVDGILDSVDTEGITVIRMMEVCESLYTEEITEGMTAEREEEPEYDEHVWTSLENAEAICRAICSALVKLDPEGAESYNSACESWAEDCHEVRDEIQGVVEGGARRTLVFADRFPFRYFTEEFGLEYYAAYPGCSTETEASAATIAFLIDKVTEEDIPAVFTIELSNAAVAGAICEATGAELLTLHSCHNVTAEDFSAGVTYLDLMRKNAQALAAALN